MQGQTPAPLSDTETNVGAVHMAQSHLLQLDQKVEDGGSVILICTCAFVFWGIGLGDQMSVSLPMVCH